MKKVIVLSLITLIIMLSSCVSNIEVESSIPFKEENESVGTSFSETSTDSAVDKDIESTASLLTENISDLSDESILITSGVTEETVLFGDFTVETEHAVYDFISTEGVGDYRTEFTTTATNPNSITITLADGRTMQLNHTGIVYDEENEIYKTEINGLDFLVYEYLDSNNNLCQVYDCIEPMDNLGDFKGRVISTITVNFNPELESGDIRMVFLYEIKEDKVIIRYPDGAELTKTIKYNNTENKYYFE